MANEKERREDEIEIKKAVKELSINEIDEIMFSSPDSATEADEEYEEESDLSDSNSIFQSITPKPLMEEKYPSPTHGQQGKGKRKTISYGSSDNISRTEQAYRAFEMAKENRKIIEGVVISATMVNMPNGLQDVLFEVVPTESIYNNISVFISGENMSKILVWNRNEDSKDATTKIRRRFGKAMLNAEIQFCIEKITVTNPQERNIEEREYFIAGNRCMANERIKQMYFNPDDPNSLQEGDIVNGRVIGVFPQRIAFTVAGIDKYLHITTPYITGASRIVPGTSGKALAVVNDEKECLINTIRRNPETKEITNLYISFYAPIEDKILKKIDAMRVGALYSGTILRFLPPTEERKHPYMVVKTDSGVEVLCTLPNWKKPPMEMDSVNVKIVEIRPNGQNTLVLGFIKR